MLNAFSDLNAENQGVNVYLNIFMSLVTFSRLELGNNISLYFAMIYAIKQMRF